MSPWIAGSSSAKKLKKCKDFQWNELSKDIQMAILVRVPLKALARCRAVCKEWNSLWGSAFFMTCCSRSPAEHPWFLFKQESDTPAPNSLCYSPAVNKWLKLSFNGILPAGVNQVAATAGGLLFCVDQPTVRMIAGDVVSFVWSTMIVCNPFQKNNQRRLPQRLWSWKPNVIAMIADPANNALAAIEFKIVLLVAGEGLEIYDSRLDNWELVRRTTNLPNELPVVYRAVVHKKWIYFLIWGLLVRYNLEKKSCIVSELPPYLNFKHTQVYSCRGTLFLVACITSDDEGEATVPRMSVWESVSSYSTPTEEDSNEEWRQLSCVSMEGISVAFSSEVAVGYGTKDLLMVRGSRMLMRDLTQKDECQILGSETRRTDLVEQANDFDLVEQANDFLYSVSLNVWYIVLESPGYINRLSEYSETSLQFEPRLQASV